MSSIFKGIGKGILYIFVCPIYLIGLVLFAIYGLFLFLIMCIRNVILFFRGMKIDYDLPEDKEAQRRIKAIEDPYEKLADEAEEKRAKARIEAQPEIIVIDTKPSEIASTTIEEIETVTPPEIEVIKDKTSEVVEEEDEILPLSDDDINSHIFKEDDE